MTLLEFVCRRLMGKPVAGSCWRCPFCLSNGPSFFVRTNMEKFKCYRCGQWGDEMDLLKLFHPQDDYSKRLERMRELRDDYEREEGIISLNSLPGSIRQQIATAAKEFCERFGMAPSAFEVYVRELAAEHIAQCRDPECDTIVCRASRGLPPLTDIELEARNAAEHSTNCRP